MAKIDIDKFIISLCENGFGTLGMGDIRNALREQGLKYEKGELLEYDKERQLTEFEKAVQSVLFTEITNAVNNDPYVFIETCLCTKKAHVSKKQLNAIRNMVPPTII